MALVSVLSGPQVALAGGRPGDHPKLDGKLNGRARDGKVGRSRVIVQFKPGLDASAQISKLGGTLGRRLAAMNGLAVEIPNRVLRKLADDAAVARVVWDRPLDSSMNRVSVTVGARAVQESYGYTGAGVGVAVIDSGITPWHDDLTYSGASSSVTVRNGQRVSAFVDFVNGLTSPYDDYGHGTHVSGIIAGNGFDSLGARGGIAPDANLVSLKVLDGNGRGVISNVIAAIDWAVAHRAAYRIRVINLSVGASVTESYKTDPLTLAAKRAVDAGIVVVAAAGNLGRNALGQPQYGGITAPGNAPWVLTAGASSTEGTPARIDDVVAPYSSRGPSAIDYQAKPDLVAPGTGVVSLANPDSLMYITKSAFLLNGSIALSTKPYLSLSGTSMAAPVVAGSVALMLQANPSLTPNLVKALLQYTAQVYPGYNALTEGAGFLNTKGAVDLAQFFKTATAGQRYPTAKSWSHQIIWGNHRIGGGVIKPNATAWKPGVEWGDAKDATATNIVWGTLCGANCDSTVWTAADSEDNIVWGTASDSEDNIVWGTAASDEGDNIVWGTAASDEDNIVWGTDCAGGDCLNVVWGSARPVSAANIVWGTASEEDNIVWGTASEEDNIVWGTASEEDNIVWGTASEEDNIVWGTSSEVDSILWDGSTGGTGVPGASDSDPAILTPMSWDDLFGPASSDQSRQRETLIAPAATAVTMLASVGWGA